MSNLKSTRTVTVINSAGVHARAALQIYQTVTRFRAKVELVKGDMRADAASMLHLMSLGAGQGEQLLLEATGDEADAALDALVELFTSKFSEPD